MPRPGRCGGEFTSLDARRDCVGQPLTPLCRVRVVEVAHGGCGLGGVHQRGHTVRQRGVTQHIGEMVQYHLDPLARRTVNELAGGIRSPIEGLQGVGDQPCLVRPMPVQRAPPDARVGRNRLHPEAAVARLGELFQRGPADHASRVLDAGIHRTQATGHLCIITVRRCNDE